MSGVAMNIVKGLKTKNYESVEDNKDLRIPVQSEEAFEQGITFKAKYIATQEVPRPASRVEIVSSMRRIRYDYKYRNIKKRKVNIEVSVDGVRVTLWKKRKKPNDSKYNESQLFVMHYPINRVFYVSHDSQDLLIFSYIARSEDGVFRCSVFKAFKKSQAMHIVRTIGQAFEVCHKLNLQKQGGNDQQNAEERGVDEDENRTKDGAGETDIDDFEETDIDDIVTPIKTNQQTVLERQQSTLVTDLDTLDDLQYNPTQIPLLNGDIGSQRHGAFTLNQLQQLYHQQLQHQIQEAEAARSEVNVLKEQIRIEAAARVEAQTRVHKLLSQNRELIITVQKLMSQVQDSHAQRNMEAVNETLIISPFPPATPPLFGSSNPPTSFSYPSSNSGTSDFASAVYDNVRAGKSAVPNGEIRNPDFPESIHNELHGQEAVGQRSPDPLHRSAPISRSSHSSGNASPIIVSSSGHGSAKMTSFTSSEQTEAKMVEASYTLQSNLHTSTNPFTNLPSDVGEEEPIPRSDNPSKPHVADSNVFSKEMLEIFSEELQELSLDNTTPYAATSLPVSPARGVLETST